jgi:menaquinone-dependent protoporphyrinogen oxidase
MTSDTALVLYASTHGHTGRIAARVGDVLRDTGRDVRVVDVQKSARVDPADFDLVVVGASVHMGHHQADVVTWLRANRAALAAVPVALFSVSLTAADDGDEARAATREYTDELLEQTGLDPLRTVAFGGALQYREYNLPTRVLLRLIARRKGLATDASVDADYTDWDAVEAFARELPALLPAAVHAG